MRCLGVSLDPIISFIDNLKSSGLGFLILLLVLPVLRVVLDASTRRSRSRRRSRRRMRPLWTDLLAISVGATLVWAIFVAPSLSTSRGTTLRLDGFSAILSCGAPISWMATIGLWLAHRHKIRHRFDRIQKVNDLLLLPHDEFEHFIAHLFRAKGNRATVVGGGGDHGVDILLESASGQRAIVQCKLWSGKWVDESVVRDLYGAMMHDGPETMGYLVTTSTFSDPARDWAEGKPITLIDGDRLARAIGELRSTG